jgi:mRNA interferase RelE/StbE
VSYRLLIRHSAEKEMDALPESIHGRLSAKILALQDQPRPMGSCKLQGGVGYRIRVGDYRVIYVIDDKSQTVHITAVAHRRDIYR